MYLTAFFGFVGGALAVVILRALNIAWQIQPAAQATLDEVAALRTRIDNLANYVAPDESTKLAYQEAGQWVRMVNTVTWTLGSIYLAGSIIALNTVLNTALIGRNWRPLIGLVVACLCVIWWIIDFVYLRSVSAARQKLSEIEAIWPTTFYREQQRASVGRYLVAAGLYFSMLLPFLLGIIVARPWLPLSVQALLPDITQTF